MNRSPTVVLGYLMQFEKMTLKAAYEHTKQRRSLISPHENYFAQLEQFELVLYGNNSFTYAFFLSLSVTVSLSFIHYVFRVFGGCACREADKPKSLQAMVREMRSEGFPEDEDDEKTMERLKAASINTAANASTKAATATATNNSLDLS